MKDSQLFHTECKVRRKYIKADNERFSTSSDGELPDV